jgi:hypothetical protein
MVIFRIPAKPRNVRPVLAQSFFKETGPAFITLAGIIPFKSGKKKKMKF